MAQSVVLVSLDWIRPGDPRTGLGVASIAATLRAQNVDTQIVGDAVNRADFRIDAYIERVVTAVQAAGPDAICGIAAFVWNEHETHKLIRAIGDNTSAKIVLGGPQVSYVGAGLLEQLYPGVDIFVRGHGEAALLGLATEQGGPGMGIHFSGAPDLGRRADLALDHLPSPHLTGVLEPSRFVRWETQRGCRYACTFCQHRESGSRLKNRNLADGRIRREIDAFHQAKVQRVAVLDPIFHADRARAVSILEYMAEVGLKAEISLQCRFELITEAFLDVAERLNVALEFGLQTTIEQEGKAVKRPNNSAQAEEVIANLHARNIPFEVSLIYGLPHQTLETFQRSIDWCHRQQIPKIRAWPLMLLRGTQLEVERDKWGYVESDDRIPIVVESKTFSRADHAAMTALAEQLNKPGFGLQLPERQVAGADPKGGSAAG